MMNEYVSVSLLVEDWYKVIDALKFKEYDEVASSKRMYSFLTFDNHECFEKVVLKYEENASAFNNLSKDIYSQIYNKAFCSGCEFEKRQSEREEAHKKWEEKRDEEIILSAEEMISDGGIEF